MKFFQATVPSNWAAKELFKFAIVTGIRNEYRINALFPHHQREVSWALDDKDFKYFGEP